MPGSIHERYAALVAEGRVERDPAQDAAVYRLMRLEERLGSHRLASKSSSLGWLFGNREKQSPLKGLYLYGDVGRGKTMLMDLFFDASHVAKKRRVHFHEFMADVHDRVQAFRDRIKTGEIADGDAIVLHGYALLFSNPVVVRGYLKLRRWFEGAFALAFGYAGVRILTAKLQT